MIQPVRRMLLLVACVVACKEADPPRAPVAAPPDLAERATSAVQPPPPPPASAVGPVTTGPPIPLPVPPDRPNYFDPRELGAASVGVIAACAAELNTATPRQAPAFIAAACLCLADLARSNMRAGRKVLGLTKRQRAACSQYASNPKGARPYARGLPSPTSEIVATYIACADARPGGHSGLFAAYSCACKTDGTLALDRAASPQDLRPCDAAAIYFARTGAHMPRELFAALHGTSPDMLSPSPPGAGAARAPAAFDSPSRDSRGSCCRRCSKGKACGDSCIAAWKTCRVGPGCAC